VVLTREVFQILTTSSRIIDSYPCPSVRYKHYIMHHNINDQNPPLYLSIQEATCVCKSSIQIRPLP